MMTLYTPISGSSAAQQPRSRRPAHRNGPRTRSSPEDDVVRLRALVGGGGYEEVVSAKLSRKSKVRTGDMGKGSDRDRVMSPSHENLACRRPSNEQINQRSV